MRLTWRVDRDRRNQIQTNASTTATTAVASAKTVERSKNNFGAMATSGTDDEGETEPGCFGVSDSEFLAESVAADAAGLWESLSAGGEGADAVVDATRGC